MSIAINSPDDFTRLLDRLAREGEDFSLEQLSFQGLKGFSVKVEGPHYNSTVTPSFMRGLLGLQDEIMRTVCELRYGVRDLRKLPEADKQELELLFKISKGSSQAEQEDPGDWFDRVSGFLLEAMKDMDSKHKALVLAVLIAGVGGYFGWSKYLDNQQATAQMALDHESQLGVQKLAESAIKQTGEVTQQAFEGYNSGLEKLSELAEKLIKKERNPSLTRMSQIAKDGLESGYKQIIENVSDATHVTVGGVRLNRKAMDFIAAKPEPIREVSEEIEEVYIEGINRKGLDDYRLTIESSKYGQISLLLGSEYIPDSHFDYLYSALKGKKKVKIEFQVATTDSRTNRARLLKVLEVPKKFSFEEFNGESQLL